MKSDRQKVRVAVVDDGTFHMVAKAQNVARLHQPPGGHVVAEASALDGLDGVVAGLVEAQVAAPVQVRDAALQVGQVAHDLAERDPADHLAAPSVTRRSRVA